MNNIKQLRQKAKLSQHALAEKLNISTQQVFRLEAGTCGLSSKMIEKLTEVFNCSVDNLISGNNLPKTINNSQIASIDIINAQACCGNGVINYEDNVIGTYSMPTIDLHRFAGTSPDNLKVISTVGDSMIPTISPGDYVIVDTSYNIPSSDGLYVIAVGLDLMVKRIQINPITNGIIIKSDNPIYEQITGPSFKDVKCVGRVLRIIRIERVS